MEYSTFLINLEDAVERRAYMDKQLDPLGISFTRINAVLGDLLEEPIENYNERRFNFCVGKRTNKRVIGCYLSHLNAMRAFLETDRPYALILEDDAKINPNITTLIDAALDYREHWDLLRLSSFRPGRFLPFGELPEGHQIAYNIKILKSTTGYFISRKAAELCLRKMLPIYLPVDVALDRDWQYGFRSACVVPFPVGFKEEEGSGMQPFKSQIPRGEKIPGCRFTSRVFNFYSHARRRAIRRKFYRAALKHPARRRVAT